MEEGGAQEIGKSILDTVMLWERVLHIVGTMDVLSVTICSVLGTFVACGHDIKDKCSLYLDLLSSGWEDLSSS